MKLSLKPGISPGAFWTFVGVGLAGLISGALQLTAYSWAPAAIGVLGAVVLFLKRKSPDTPAK